MPFVLACGPLVAAGATRFVAGNAVYGQPDPAGAIRGLLAAAEGSR